MPRKPNHPTSERAGIVAAMIAQYATEAVADTVLDWLHDSALIVLDMAGALRDWWHKRG